MMLRLGIILTLTTYLNYAFSQINQHGVPFITNYPPSEYEASEQNWTITQDHRGVMYFGNNDNGILEFDGVNWRKIPINNKSIVRSLALGNDRIIYVGAVDEFGCIEINPVGKTQYISFMNLLDSTNQNISSIWKIYPINNQIFFCSTKGIFKYQSNKITRFPLPQTAFFTFLINKELYVGDFLKGLHKFENNQIKLMENGQFFSQKGIFSLNALDSNKLMVGTNPDGIFLYQNGKIKPFGIDQKVNQFVIENQLYNTCPVDAEKFALATLNGGIITTDKRGYIKEMINKSQGLQDETTICLQKEQHFQSQNLWAGLNSGISKIEILSNLFHFNNFQGIEGNVNDICEFNNTLFIATSTGVYYLNKNSDNAPSFKPISEITNQAWTFLSLQSNNPELIIGTESGLYSINSKMEVQYIDPNLRKKSESDLKNYIYKVYKSKHSENEIIVGLINSLFVIKKNTQGWAKSYSLKKITEESRNIAQNKDSSIWIGTAFNGVIRCKINKQDTIITKFTNTSGLPSLKDIFVSELNDEIFFGTEHGLYFFNATLQKFEPEHKFGKEFCDGSMGVFRFNQAPDGYYWFSLFNDKKKWVERGHFDSTGTYIRDTLPFKRLPNEQFDAIYHDSDGITWLGSSSGLYSYNPKIKVDYNTPFFTLVRKVTTVNDSVLFWGTNYTTDSAGNRIVSVVQPESLKPILDYSFNDLTFEYAAPYFIEEKKTEYAYLLEGYKDNWSKWSTEPKAVFTNLREGKYNFKVKAKNIYGFESEIGSYEFTILPPWYRTIWAYFVYTLLGILFIIAIVKLYTRKLRLEKIRLEGIVMDRTAEIRCQKEAIEQKNEILKEQKAEIETQAHNLTIANEVLHEQKEEILKQKEEITSSIIYAKRIQRAIVPSEQMAQELLKDYFLLWRPRDIVSGDFWWLSERNDKIIVAAADCTGHGVPGAFMSMLGVSFLNEIVNQRNITESHEILNNLRHKVKLTLGQTGRDGEAKDGMDIALMVIDFKNQLLQYSGAYNPMYLYRKGELMEYKADKNPIGIYIKEKESFTQNIIPLEKGDTLYIFSDGYVDQFGGADRNKYTTKRFKEFLLTIQHIPMAEQRELLDQNINSWMDGHEQIDDIIVLGVRI